MSVDNSGDKESRAQSSGRSNSSRSASNRATGTRTNSQTRSSAGNRSSSKSTASKTSSSGTKSSGGSRTTATRSTRQTPTKSNTLRPRASYNDETASQENRGRYRGENYGRVNETMKDEIVLIVVLLLCILMVLSYFGICGIVGTGVNAVVFGLFGKLGYALPFIVLLFTLMFAANDGRFVSTRRVVCSILFLIIIAALVQMFGYGYNEELGLSEYFKNSLLTYEGDQVTGGGFLGGLVIKCLCPLFGQVGAVIIMLAIALMMMVLITGKAFVTYFSKRIKEIGKSRLEERRIAREERRIYDSIEGDDTEYEDYIDDDDNLPRVRRRMGSIAVESGKQPEFIADGAGFYNDEGITADDSMSGKSSNTRVQGNELTEAPVNKASVNKASSISLNNSTSATNSDLDKKPLKKIKRDPSKPFNGRLSELFEQDSEGNEDIQTPQPAERTEKDLKNLYSSVNIANHNSASRSTAGASGLVYGKNGVQPANKSVDSDNKFASDNSYNQSSRNAVFDNAKSLRSGSNDKGVESTKVSINLNGEIENGEFEYGPKDFEEAEETTPSKITIIRNLEQTLDNDFKVNIDGIEDDFGTSSNQNSATADTLDPKRGIRVVEHEKNEVSSSPILITPINNERDDENIKSNVITTGNDFASQSELSRSNENIRGNEGSYSENGVENYSGNVNDTYTDYEPDSYSENDDRSEGYQPESNYNDLNTSVKNKENDYSSYPNNNCNSLSGDAKPVNSDSEKLVSNNLDSKSLDSENIVSENLVSKNSNSVNSLQINSTQLDNNKSISEQPSQAYRDSSGAVRFTDMSAQALEKAEPPQPEYIFPPIEFLRKGTVTHGNEEEKERELYETIDKLQRTFESFGVGVKVTDASVGPTVTRYELLPDQGVKVKTITSLSDDIKLALAAAEIRIEAPIPGKAAVGIEVPNKENEPVFFGDLIDSDEFRNSKSKLSIAIGKDISGQSIVSDIAGMPHALIAGATGSGKSVCINALIMSILYKAKPSEVKMIMIDPKRVELVGYNGIPHLLVPVVTDVKKATGALNWAIAEMDDRYKRFADCGVTNLKSYNALMEEQYKEEGNEGECPDKLPQIVIIVDELNDLMMTANSKEVEGAICRLTQLARACGIHVVLATQRPSVNVITGTIKANIPTRMAFAVSSLVDSRTIIDQAGAEKLLGKGDMLFYPQGYPKPVRLQGAFVSDGEVKKVVDHIKATCRAVRYSDAVSKHIETNSEPKNAAAAADDKNQPERTSGRDELFGEAGKFIIEKEKASIGMLQRVYKIGFNRAARIMDQLCDAGVVGPEEGTKPRKILMNVSEFDEFINLPED